MDCGSDQSKVERMSGFDAERVRRVVSEMYAVVLAGAFVILITIDKDPIHFYAVDWPKWGLHVLLFGFLWIEWLWTEHFFNPGDSNSQPKLLLNTFVHVAQLWCICFCCVFYIRGDSSSALSYNTFALWFALYLFWVILWGALNHKSGGSFSSSFFNLLNVYVFSLFVVLWRLDITFNLHLEEQLRNGVVTYMAFCIVMRVMLLILWESRWLKCFSCILAGTRTWDI